jgi:putative tryptophan/tyrosine transport system substrate-binding protein
LSREREVLSIAEFRLRIGPTAILIAALALSVVWASHPVDAQQPAKAPRIGFLGATTESGVATRLAAFREGLRELGYVEGKNLAIEFRWAEGKYERLPDLAAELVGLKVAVIVTHGTPAARAAKQATKTIAIVMAASGDAVATGLVAGIARPGGNITGTTFFNPEISARRLELLKEAVPRIRRVAVLVNPDNPARGPVLQAMEPTARSLQVELVRFEARGPQEFEGVFAGMAQSRVEALTIIEDPVLLDNVRGLASLAAKHRSPSSGFKEFARAGGLMAYAVDLPAMYRQGAVFVDKVLKGAKPGDLPVQQATKFELIINLKTAKALGLTIPQSVLIRADEVIQ